MTTPSPDELLDFMFRGIEYSMKVSVDSPAYKQGCSRGYSAGYENAYVQAKPVVHALEQVLKTITADISYSEKIAALANAGQALAEYRKSVNRFSTIKK